MKPKTPQQLEAEADRLLAQQDKLIADGANDKYKVFATKIEADAARRFEEICARDKTTPYEVQQMLIAAYIRMKDALHVLTDAMRRLMVAFEVSVHFLRRLQITDPSAKVSIMEATYFLGDPKQKGMHLRHVYRPFMGDAEETDNKKEILERTLEEMPEIYAYLKRKAKMMGADSIYEMHCIEASENAGIDDQNYKEETFDLNDYSEFGKRMEQVRYKQTQINSMEAFERRQTALEFPEWTVEDQINETF